MYETNPARVNSGPSRWWYAVAVALVLVSLIPIGIFGVNAVDAIRDYELTPFDGDTAEVDVSDDNRVAVFIDNEHTRYECSAKDADGKDMELDSPDTTLNITTDGDQWYRAVRTGKSWEPGTYTITCATRDGDQVAYADDPKLGSSIAKFLGSIALIGVACTVALIIAIVVAVKRSRAKRENTQGFYPPPGGGQWQPPQQGGPPPPQQPGGWQPPPG